MAPAAGNLRFWTGLLFDKTRSYNGPSMLVTGIPQNTDGCGLLGHGMQGLLRDASNARVVVEGRRMGCKGC